MVACRLTTVQHSLTRLPGTHGYSGQAGAFIAQTRGMSSTHYLYGIELPIMIFCGHVLDSSVMGYYPRHPKEWNSPFRLLIVDIAGNTFIYLVKFIHCLAMLGEICCIEVIA